MEWHTFLHPASEYSEWLHEVIPLATSQRTDGGEEDWLTQMIQPHSKPKPRLPHRIVR